MLEIIPLTRTQQNLLDSMKKHSIWKGLAWCTLVLVLLAVHCPFDCKELARAVWFVAVGWIEQVEVFWFVSEPTGITDKVVLDIYISIDPRCLSMVVKVIAKALRSISSPRVQSIEMKDEMVLCDPSSMA
jgi:hypothetical protein